MKKSKWMIIGAMAMAFGFVLAGCEHRATPPSEEEVAAEAFAEDIGGDEKATVKGTTVTIVATVAYGGNADTPLPAGVTIKVSSGKTLTLGDELFGSPGTTFIVESNGGVAGDGATNFYDENAEKLEPASVAKGTYVWEKITIKGNSYGWVAQPKPAEKT